MIRAELPGDATCSAVVEDLEIGLDEITDVGTVAMLANDAPETSGRGPG